MLFVSIFIIIGYFYLQVFPFAIVNQQSYSTQSLLGCCYLLSCVTLTPIAIFDHIQQRDIKVVSNSSD